MSEIAKSKYNPGFIILLCSIFLLVIMQPWNLYFLNDDFEHIPVSGNILLVTKNFLRPVANLFLFIDKHLYNKQADGYFFTTWLLHAACTAGIYLVSLQVIKKYTLDLPAYTALLTALFFLFYPFHAESLFWIIARGSVIAALFAIMSLYFYLKKNENYSHLLIALLFFVAALFTYESIWNVLFFYCVISFYNIKKKSSALEKECFHAGIFVLTFLLYLLVRLFSLDTLTGGYTEIDTNIFKVPLLLANLLKLVARNFTPPFHNTVFSIIFFSSSVIVFVLAMLLMFKKDKSTGWLMVILWLGVISGVITAAPLGIDTHGNESERYIYYSSFFFCFFLAAIITLIKKKEWKYIITGFIIVSEITGLIVYNAHYRYTSAVVKKSLEFIKKYPDYKNVYFIDVPGEYKGALIFRACLPNAIRWIASECKYDSVIIISQTEDASGILPYQTGEKTWMEFSIEKRFQEQTKQYAVKDTLGRNILLNENDAVFWFAKKGLYKVRRP